jgi:hypothetical protein
MTLFTVSNKTWLNVEGTLNSWNWAKCSIASARGMTRGSIQLNGKSIGTRKIAPMVRSGRFGGYLKVLTAARKSRWRADCPGAGGPATASAVVADIGDIARGVLTAPFGRPSARLTTSKKAPIKAVTTSASLR